MVLVQDLLHPTAASEARKHKLKQLVQSPRSFFMDVKCPGCLNITTVFSHAQTAVTCDSCATVLSQPTGGKARLTEGSSFQIGASHGDVSLKAADSGKYGYCFSNEYSSIDTKDVSFNIHGVVYIDVNDPNSDSLDAAVKRLSVLTSEVKNEQVSYS
ncbi:unnamed protein product [Wickerhamomyces anomalus]